MAGGWKRFDAVNVAKANAPGRIFVIRRPNGKLNIGQVEVIARGGVKLINGNWDYFAEFGNQTPSSMFIAIDPPQMDIEVGDRKLV